MEIHSWVWFATVGVLVGVLALDLFISTRRPHAVTIKEATSWVLFYIGCAIAFGVALGALTEWQYAAEFFAGYITEYSLSVDNLFVFVIIMTSFAVPAIHQHKVLLFGIVLALVLRGIFIAVGAAAIARFSWIFYIFGAFLIYTGINLARHRDEEPEMEKNALLRFVERVLPTTREYHGTKVSVKIDGKRVVTPLLIVMIAIGSTDILFALDSIPAIFGLTQEAYIVFTANVFALMGLRQLYFLLHGLLDRLIYLSIGLAVILGFIGIKLIMEAAHETWEAVPHIPISVSLGFILVTLVITTVASLWKVKRDPSAIKKLGGHGPAQPAEALEDIPEETTHATEGSRRL